MKTFAQLVEEKAQLGADQILKNTKLLRGAKDGSLLPKDFIHYLSNLYFILSASEAHLPIALRKAQEEGNAFAIHYYMDKIMEEDGHEEWALNDLKLLGLPGKPATTEMTRATARLIFSYGAMIREASLLFIAYIYTVEAITVRLSPEFLKNCAENCGIEKERLSAISKHLEADEHHVNQGNEILEKIPLNETEKERFLALVDQSLILLRDCMDSYVLGERTDARVATL